MNIQKLQQKNSKNQLFIQSQQLIDDIQSKKSQISYAKIIFIALLALIAFTLLTYTFYIFNTEEKEQAIMLSLLPSDDTVQNQRNLLQEKSKFLKSYEKFFKLQALYKDQISNRFKRDIEKYKFYQTDTKPQGQVLNTLKFWKLTGNNQVKNKELQEIEKIQKNYYQQKYQISKYKEVQICVVVLSYMNEAKNRYKRNLDSIFQQQYQNYKVFYVDDHSSDSTGQLVQNYMKNNKLQSKMKLYRNNERKGKSYNQFFIGQENCKPGSIMIVLDGDDELIGKQVFKFISAAYQLTGSYYIYTNFLMIKQETHEIGIGFSQPLSQDVIVTRNYRLSQMPSHLRTWMSDLFLDIKKQDLFFNGNFPQIGEDVGTSFQLMEKAGTKVSFFNQYVHRYVIATGLNDYEKNRNLQLQIDYYYRSMPKFKVYDKKIQLNLKP